MSEAETMQTRYVETSSQLDLVKSQIMGVERSVKYAEINQKQVAAEVGSDARVWQGVGKMFLATSVQDFEKSLEQKAKDAEEQISALSKKKQYLELTLKNLTMALKEAHIAVPQ